MRTALIAALLALVVAGCTSTAKTDESGDGSACTTDSCSESAEAESSAYSQAYEHYEKKNYEKAIELAELAIEKNDNSDLAYELVGLAQFQLGDWQKALDGFSGVSQDASEELIFRVRSWMAQCMFRLNNFQGTLDVLDELAGHRDLEHTELNLRAYALVELGRNEEAISELKKAIELAPEGEEKENYKTALKHIQK